MMCLYGLEPADVSRGTTRETEEDCKLDLMANMSIHLYIHFQLSLNFFYYYSYS